jgi:hypothetical protein
MPTSTTPTLLFGGLWYTSAAAVGVLSKTLTLGKPHLTPEGKAVLVFDAGGPGSIVGGMRTIARPALVPQGEDGHDLCTVNENRVQRVELSPEDCPDLERLVAFDHLPEGRKAGPIADGLHKPGDRLA